MGSFYHYNIFSVTLSIQIGVKNVKFFKIASRSRPDGEEQRKKINNICINEFFFAGFVKKSGGNLTKVLNFAYTY